MTEQELINTTGGTRLNASWLNAISRGIDTVYNLGKSVGTIIRMLISKTKC